MPSSPDFDETKAFFDRRNRRRLLKNRIYDFGHRAVVYFLAGSTALIVGNLLFQMGYFSIFRYPSIRKEKKIHEKYLLNSDEEEKKK